MRRTVLSLVLASLAPVAAAAGPCEVAADRTRDTAGERVLGHEIDPARDGHAASDLTGLRIEPGRGTLRIALRVADVDGPLHPDADAAHFYAGWKTGDRYPDDYYLVEAERRARGWRFGWAHDFPSTVGSEGASRPVRINSFDPDTTPVEGSIDAATDEIRFELPLAAMGDPPAGTVLRRISLKAFQRASLAPATSVNDEVWRTLVSDYGPDDPDEPAEEFTYTIGTSC